MPIDLDTGKIFTVWSQRPFSRDTAMLWAASSLGFFRCGELLTPSKNGFVPSRHLCWGDVRVDAVDDPKLLCVNLRVSKCDLCT